jgi:hypothetical protein
MKSFAEYYEELLKREGIEFQELISTWREDLIAEIKDDFQQAISNSHLKKSVFVPNKTNQSVGNQVEISTIDELNNHLKCFNIEKCSGAGYPDRILARGDFRHIALEMKATGSWNPQDSNRRVLTSASKKLRLKFTLPIYHLLCTVVYKSESKAGKVEGVRLDFIEPLTQVSIRLEASVSHKILASGTHQSILF